MDRKGAWRRGLWIVALALACAAPGARAASAEGDARAVVRGNTAFALDLYDRLRAREGNLFLSPFSASTALTMTLGGARGETEAQMARVLHLDLPRDRLHPALGSLGEVLAREGPCVLRPANALWAQTGYPFRAEYRDLMAECYDAGFRELDFERATERARRTINAWVADRTEGRIEEVLRPGDLSPAAALVLTNAVYFQGRWALPFEERFTGEGPFRTGSGGEVRAAFMHTAGRLPFAETDDVEILELPYDGERLSMVVLLPKDPAGLARLERSLTVERLEGWLGKLEEVPLRVRLPRFRIETRFDLSRTLRDMGMTDAFDPRRADFSGMTGGRELFLSLVVHQAEVEVDEEGTVAAAATAVVLKRGAPPREFAADHPFLFLVCDRESGSVLFLGRVADPVR